MKKRILAMLLAAIMLLGIIPVVALATDDAIEVSNQAELAAMSDADYILTGDITLSGWTPISGFSGTLDGNGHTITLSEKPLFSTMSGRVTNLILAGEVSESATSNTGALAQNCSGTIRNCMSSANVTFSGTSPYIYVGGLAGKVNGTIANCVVTGSVTGGAAYCYGAISNIALFESGTIKDCVAIGERIASTETWTGSDANAGTDCTLVADASAFNPSDYLTALNAKRETGDLEWEIKSGKLSLKSKAAAPIEPASQEDIDQLEAALNVAKAVDSAKVYTSESYTALKTAMQEAKAQLDAETKRKDKVLAAQSALESAVAGLAERNTQPVDLTGKSVISITTADQLEYLQDGKYYRLDADITLGDYWFGYFYTMNAVLDGNGHTVTLNGAPLWSAIGKDGVIQNLGIKGSAKNMTDDTGAIAKDCEGLIVNSWSSANVNSAGQNSKIKNAGGFAANLKSGGAIVNCYISGSVVAAGNSGDGKVGVFTGTAAENTLVKCGYWINTLETSAVGKGEGGVSGCATKTRADFYSDEFLALLNSQKGSYGSTWTINDEGWPHLGAAGSYVPPQPIELNYTAYEGYGSGVTKFTDAKGLLLSLDEVLPNPETSVTYFVGKFSYPGYSGEVAFVPLYTANGQGNHKVFVSEEGELQVLGAGSLDVEVYDKSSWSGTQYEKKLTGFTITISSIEAEEIRLAPAGEHVTKNTDGSYNVAGSASVTLNPEVKVNGAWRSAPASLFSFFAKGEVRQSGGTIYATKPGDIEVTVSGLGKSAKTKITSTYVAVKSITPAPSGTYYIHGRNANSSGLGEFLDLTLSDNAGTVIVLPENASYKDSWTMQSSNPEVAYFGASYMKAIVPLKAGTTTLKAISTDPGLTGEVSGTSTITLEYFNPLKSVEISDTEISVKENETISLPLVFNSLKGDEGYHATEPGMTWSFSGKGEVEITRAPLGVIVGSETSKEYCVANSEYKLIGVSAGEVTVTGTPIDTTAGAKPITFKVNVTPGAAEAPANTDKIVKEGIKSSSAYIKKLYKDWKFSYGDEWAVFILERSQEGLSKEEADYYVNSVAKAYANPTATELKPTTIARVILAVSAVGEDATDVNGIDLVDMLCSSDAISDGSNEAIWALIALDCKDYDIPEKSGLTRRALIKQVLKYQNAASGAFGLTDNTTASVDMTAMAVQALAPYYDSDNEVKAAVDAALGWIKSEMDRNCDFASSESTSQVLIALSAMNIDAADENSGFTKSAARNIITAIDRYSCADGGFKHLLNDEKSNGMATLQALMAFEAYERFTNGENRLYDLSEEQPAKPVKPENPNEKDDKADLGDVKTADESNLLLLIAIMAISAALAAVILPIRKKFF